MGKLEKDLWKHSNEFFFCLFEMQNLWKHSADAQPRKSCPLVRDGKKGKVQLERTHFCAVATKAVKSKTFEKTMDRRRKAPPETCGKE